MGKICHKEKTLEQRLRDSTKVLKLYPDRICIYIEKKTTSKNINDLEKNKYLVPKTITAAQFIYVIRSKLQITKETGVFFYIDNRIISGDTQMEFYNNNYKNPDGFLYITYASENCFG